MRAGLLALALALALAASAPAIGQPPLETLEVVGTTPLGAGLDANKVASNVQRAVADDIREQGALDLADFMRRNLASVFVNEAQSNPLQPDVQYRGFVGSPLLGLPQGLAVYQDGVRLNEPFGDTVNWALVPESAIDAVYLMPGSNPLFGLNALGGAISIETKSGFSHAGTSAELVGGSFGRIGAQVETGGSPQDDFSYFVTASYLEENGWRDFSPTEALQFFTRLGWDVGKTSIDASFTYADTDLIGNGAAPVDLLELDRRAVFTRPDRTRNELELLSLKADRAFTDTLGLTGNLYLRRSNVDTLNGDDSEFRSCEGDPRFLCEERDEDEEPIVDSNGNPVPTSDALEGATINRTDTKQDGAGLGLQAVWSGELAGRANRLIAGVAHDTSNIAFAASSELGALDETRFARPGGVFVGGSFTRMKADTANSGLYVSNTFSFRDTLALTVSGRYNRTTIELHDELGTALDGDHEFERFNPAVGLTFAATENFTIYASYSESNRAPSPVELTCADEDDPCRLPNAFLADPPLEQVVAKTFEAGIRGHWSSGDIADGDWHAGVFRTTNEDDIVFVSAGALTSEGFFDNIGKTRRDGIELTLTGRFGEGVDWFASYTYLDATFRAAFSVPSPNNLAAIGGEIAVEVGDRLPLIPDNLLKIGARIAATPNLAFGADLLASSGQRLRGDEGGLVDEIGSYALLNLRGEYRVSNNIRVFLNIDNVLDTEYETFGAFGDADDVLGEEFEDTRFLGPGAPRAAWVGVRLQF